MRPLESLRVDSGPPDAGGGRLSDDNGVGGKGPDSGSFREPVEHDFTEEFLHENLPAVLVVKHNELDRLLKELNDISNALKSTASPDIQDLSAALMRAVRGAIRQSLLDRDLCSLALIDDLTGLHNRRGFLALAHQQLKHAYRNGQELLLFCADVDNLKQINDSYGHPEGDLALVRAAKALRHTFRDSDILARFGGDEFCMIATEATIQNERRMRGRLEESLRRFNAGEGRYSLSLSIGAARFDPGRPATVEQLIAEADQKMYGEKRKRQGRPNPAHVSG
jgi:diguanylate cyclase (GGDEF)-like protein